MAPAKENETDNQSTGRSVQNVNDAASVARDVSAHSLRSEATDGANTAQHKKGGSRVLSHATGRSSTNAEFRFAREISETFSMKLREMKWCFLALICNALMLAAVRAMAGGVIVDMGKDQVQTIEGIVMIILLLLINIFTILGMDSGLSAFFGYQLATRGRSMSVIGFSQASSAMKFSYANDLSLNSSVRKILGRLSYIWAIAEFLKILTPIGASGLYSEELRVDSDIPINCIIFGQEGVPVDRKFPNVEVEIGLAELVFGKSIGRLRSQEPVDVTTAIVGPQLIGVVTDGDTIVGGGYEIKLYTTCECSVSTDIADLEAVGVPTTKSAAFQTAALAADRKNYYITTYLSKNATAITLTNTLLNTYLCGGYETFRLPVCTTTFWDHKEAEIIMEYMTDGTTASIAQRTAYTRVLGAEASLDWAYAALQNMLGSDVQTIVVPSQVPGMMTPLFWWTTPNLMAMDPTLVEAGLETTFTMLFRAGVQRTYSHSGHACVKNIADETKSVLNVLDYGVEVMTAALIIQLIFTGIAMAAFIPWLFSAVPAGPAIRAMNESIYFTALLADSNLSDNLKGLCNAPTHAVWQSLDIVVRIGESIMTQDEEIGHITMDKPKVVRPMVNARRYA